MSKENLISLLSKDKVPLGGCVAAALDAVSHKHDMPESLYKLSADFYNNQTGGGVNLTAGDVYSLLSKAVGCDDESEWKEPEEMTEGYFRKILIDGFRVIGEFTGIGHTVGLVLNDGHFNFVGIELATKGDEVEHGTKPVSNLQYFLNIVNRDGGWIRILPPEA